MFRPALVSAFLSVLFLTLPASGTRADEVTVVFSIAKPPFVFATEAGPAGPGDRGGIEPEIMKAALYPSGHSIAARYATYNELTDEVLAGKADAAATVRPENPTLFYSNEFVYFHNYAIVRPGAKAPVEIADLAGLSMVAWQGATKDLGPAFAAAARQSPNYAEMGNQKSQVRAFLDGKYDALIIDGTIFRYWAKVMHKRAGDYRFHSLFGGRTPFVVGFRDAKLRDDFNAGLKEIRQNGIYELLFNRHTAD